MLSSICVALACAESSIAAQTANQQLRMAELSAAAARASQRASPNVLDRLAATPLREKLAKFGAGDLASLSAPELLHLWHAEMDVAEIAHGFDTRHNFDDVDLPEAAKLQYFPNQWQLEVLYPRNVSSSNRSGRYGIDGFFGTVSAAGAAEISPMLYGLANFSGKVPSLPGGKQPLVPGGWPSNLAEASERMVYAVLNSHRLDFPTWKWGNAALVFNSSALSPLITLSPMDTGDFTGGCPKVAPNFTAQFCGAWAGEHCDFWFCKSLASGHCVPSDGFPPSVLCDLWNGTLGTALQGHYDHILIPWADWHGEHADDNLALMLSRMLRSWWAASPAPVAAYPNFTYIGNTNAGDYYHEANLVGTPVYARGAVKFVLAQFAQHFGSASGIALRAWAAAMGWPLLWAWGVGGRPILSQPGSPWAATHRVVDPGSLQVSWAGGNISKAATSAAARWEEVWAEVEAAHEQAPAANITEGELWYWWLQLQTDFLTVEPVRAYACKSPHSCVGVDRSGHCICYNGA